MQCKAQKGTYKAFIVVSAMLVFICDSVELFVICENFLGLFVREWWTLMTDNDVCKEWTD